MTTSVDRTERLRRFLLDDVSEAEREAIERQCLAEHSLMFEQLVVLEDELRFEYLQGRLSPKDYAHFAQRYVSDADGRAKLAFAQALLLAADAAPVTAPTPRVERSRMPRLVWIGAAAAAVALSVIAGVEFHAARQLQQNLQEAQAEAAKNISALAAAQADTARSQAALATVKADANATHDELAHEQALVQQVEHRLEDEGRTHVTLPPPQPAGAVSTSATGSGPGEQVAQGLPSLTLRPGLIRSGQELSHIELVDATKGVQLALTLPSGAAVFPAYAAALLTAEGKPIWTAAHLPRSGKAVAFAIPAGRLKRADYQVLLRGLLSDGRTEDVAGYAFRVAATASGSK